MFVVPDVPLIPQQNKMACWYACAQMLIQWKRNVSASTRTAQADPSELLATRLPFKLNQPLSPRFVLYTAKLLGLQPVPPMSATLDSIETWLHSRGPLWTHGKRHVVVITGVDKGMDRVAVHDPSPMRVGRREWRSYSGWFIGGGDWDSQATGPKVEASFLYHP